jgi:hypothetical protein
VLSGGGGGVATGACSVPSSIFFGICDLILTSGVVGTKKQGQGSLN